LTAAVKAEGMRLGLYYSGGLDWMINDKMPLNGYYPKLPDTEEYASYADFHLRELITKFNPDILWNDINYPKKGELVQILAEYYSYNPDGVVNDRWKLLGFNGDFDTPEYGSFSHIQTRKWESTRGIGFSFGYNQNEQDENLIYVQNLVHLFIDIVSKNGNLLLGVGPAADGSISDIQMERLIGFGEVVKRNAEAIFDTEPFTVAEGSTWEDFPIRFTWKPASKIIYAIILLTEKPGPLSISFKKVPFDLLSVSSASVIGIEGQVDMDHNSVTVRIDPQNMISKYAVGVKFQLNE